MISPPAPHRYFSFMVASFVSWLLTLLSFFLRVNSKRSGARGIPGTLYNLPPVSARVRSCIFGLFRNECFLFVFGELKLMLRLR